MLFQTILIFTSIPALVDSSSFNEHNKHKHSVKTHCFSCASYGYLHQWDKLLAHYYPPKNFTDLCWQPDFGIGVVPCNSACFTLVEEIDGSNGLDYEDRDRHRGVLRGCMDRLLLFGLDADVRNIMSSYESQRLCRHTDRKILRLIPLSQQTETVTFCSCVGDFCNEQDMLQALNRANHLVVIFLPVILILLLISTTCLS